MTKKHILSFLIIAALLQSCAEKNIRSIAFYNVENLFDTLDTPDKNDAEFLPDGKNEWNSFKYNEKLMHITKVYNELDCPIVMGFCEIENRSVVEDLVKAAGLTGKYAVVHEESLDERGIDNALMYDSTLLHLKEQGILRFPMPEGFSPSRDILWAKFSHEKSELVVMVNHWPSRSGGQVESEPKRLVAAQAAAKFIDSLTNVNKNTKFVFMGDLNDTPKDIAPKMVYSRLNGMIVTESGQFGGTHNYRGEWDILDHILVSNSAFADANLKVVKNSGLIHSPDFLLTEYKGNIVPNRTYGGGNYLGGYSDHLPVSIKIQL